MVSLLKYLVLFVQSQLAVGINVLASLISDVVISFSASWRTTVVILAIIPGVALRGYLEMQASAGID